MSDRELCMLVAKIWVENGGDAEGIDWNVYLIKECIKELTNDNND